MKSNFLNELIVYILAYKNKFQPSIYIWLGPDCYGEIAILLCNASLLGQKNQCINITKSGYGKILKNIVYLHIRNQNKSKDRELLENKNPITVSNIF